MASLRRASAILAAFVAGNFVALHILLAGKVLSDFSNFDYYFKTEIWSPPAAYLLVVAFYTLSLCLNALLPTLVALILTETLRIRRAWFYVLAAGFGALMLDVMCSRYDFVQARSFCHGLNLSELLIVTVAGMAAGYVFWRLAGCRAGDWSSKVRSLALARD